MRNIIMFVMFVTIAASFILPTTSVQASEGPTPAEALAAQVAGQPLPRVPYEKGGTIGPLSLALRGAGEIGPEERVISPRRISPIGYAVFVGPELWWSPSGGWTVMNRDVLTTNDGGQTWYRISEPNLDTEQIIVFRSPPAGLEAYQVYVQVYQVNSDRTFSPLQNFLGWNASSRSWDSF